MPNNPYTLSHADKTKLLHKHWRSLSDSDRAKVSSAAMKVLKYTGIGASIGLVAGWILARRSRSSALKIANAFKPAEQPTVVVFPNGRTVGGGLAGIRFANRELSGDTKTVRRINSALFRYQIEVWRTQADRLERMLKNSGSLFVHLGQQYFCSSTFQSLRKVVIA
ncbi:MAG: hypothetical protein LQ339_006868 [Xanthoria mediterranea]|nr:MAG: hypothetical protein LQ339_006868 [Xanthoria mediterranea]